MQALTRKHLTRTAALLLGLLAALPAAELAYRLLRIGRLGPTTHPAYVAHDDGLGWAYRPHARARHVSAEFDVEVRINASGFRGPDWPAAATGPPRVLVLGDSYAFGWGVSEEESVVGRLRALAPDWQVLGAGVSGYGTTQQALLLAHLLPDVRPDLVVCLFCPNDLFESGAPVAYGKRKPWSERVVGRLEVRGRPVPRSWLERHSVLWRALQKHLWERKFARTPRRPAAEWALVAALFERMAGELAAAGAGGRSVPLLVLSEQDELATLAERTAGMHHLDLRPVLAPAAEGARFPLDGHWTPRGHELVARALAARLAELAP